MRTPTPQQTQDQVENIHLETFSIESLAKILKQV